MDMQGRSLLPLLKGETPEDWRESIYYQYYEFPGSHNVRRHYGVRNHRYKLIHFYMIDGWELYDLEKDPQELNSVYGEPAYAKITDEMRKELLRLRKKYLVPEDKRPLPKIIREIY
jgi:arylsulfatase A-like enzyme